MLIYLSEEYFKKSIYKKIVVGLVLVLQPIIADVTYNDVLYRHKYIILFFILFIFYLKKNSYFMSLK